MKYSMTYSEYVEELKVRAAIMEAYASGEPIQFRLSPRYRLDEKWGDVYQLPTEIGPNDQLEHRHKLEFNFKDYEYRVYVEPAVKPYINWDHVSSKYNYLCVDASGTAFLYVSKPFIGEAAEWWPGVNNDCTTVEDVFESFKPGNVNWKESLIVRPGVVDV